MAKIRKPDIQHKFDFPTDYPKKTKASIWKQASKYLGRLVIVLMPESYRVKKEKALTPKQIKKLFKFGGVKKLTKSKENADWVIGEGGFSKAVMARKRNQLYVQTSFLEKDGNEATGVLVYVDRLNELAEEKKDYPKLCQELKEYLLFIEAVATDEPAEQEALALYRELVDTVTSSDTVPAEKFDHLLDALTEYRYEGLPWDGQLHAAVSEVTDLLADWQECLSTSPESMERGKMIARTLADDYKQIRSPKPEVREKLKAISSEYLAPPKAVRAGELTPYYGEPLMSMITSGQEGYERGQPFLSETMLKDIGRQLASGLDDMHKVGLAHGDISLNNVLVDSASRLRIIDFDLLRQVEDVPASRWNPPLSRIECNILNGFPQVPRQAPDRYIMENPDKRAEDVWSAGLILAHLMTRIPIASHQLSGDFLKADKNGESCAQVITEHVGNKCIAAAEKMYGKQSDVADLMRRIFVTDPRQRMTAEQMKSHPFFTSGQSVAGR